MKYLTAVNGKTYEIEINQNGRVIIDGVERKFDIRSLQPNLYSLLIDNLSFEALVEGKDNAVNVMLGGDLFEVTVEDERERRLAAAGSGFQVEQGEISVRSPMPGLIVVVQVADGDEVTAGQALVVLESMKMENQLKAPRAGKVSKVHIQAGERVEQNRLLITLL